MLNIESDLITRCGGGSVMQWLWDSLIRRAFYKTIVRPALLYGAEWWEMKKQEDKIHVAEMCMLRVTLIEDKPK